MKNVYKPVFYRLNNDAEISAFDTMKAENNLEVYDTIEDQLVELLLCRNPSKKENWISANNLVQEHVKRANCSFHNYGIWVHYPWNNQLVHLLDEEEFIEVRTNRNKYKITEEEQDALRFKKIGIAGLSVGRAVALTMASERICGEIRLADFDRLDLSNLNRIKAPIADIGISKCVSAAREIAGFDPFIKVKCYQDGLTEENLHEFFTHEGRLDLFVEECDGLDIKVLSRLKARELKIPVIMEASDRAMVDIERFDLEPERKLLHGRLEGLDVKKLKSLKSSDDKMPYMLDVVGYETLSPRIKASMLEINESIRTWPQLSSAISFGGGLVTNISRRILLQEITVSGRFYNDMNDLISNKSVHNHESEMLNSVHQEEEWSRMIEIVNTKNSYKDDLNLSDQLVNEIISEACLATSIANSQPWKWIYRSGSFYLFLDRFLSKSFWDRYNSGSLASLGASLFNLEIALAHRGYGYQVTLEDARPLVASIQVNNNPSERNERELYPLIHRRRTSRDRFSNANVSIETIQELNNFSSDSFFVQVISDRKKIKLLAQLLGALDRIRILNKRGHTDFYNEVKFTEDHSNIGISAKSLGLDFKEYAGLRIAKDASVSENLTKWKLGTGLDSISKSSVESSGAVCLISVKKDKKHAYIEGGKLIQKIWLKCTEMNVSVHPITTAVFMFQILNNGNLDGLREDEIEEIESIHSQFYSIFENKDSGEEFFLFRVFQGSDSAVDQIRRDVSKVLRIIK